jgi:hypothetical protein
MQCTIKVENDRGGDHRITGTVGSENFSLSGFKRPESALKAALAIEEAYREDSHNWSGRGDNNTTLEVNLS